MKKGQLKLGDVVWAEFDPSVGHEYQSKRPAVIVQSNKKSVLSNLVTVLPLTSSTANATPDDIMVKADDNNRLRCDSLVKVYCLTSFDYSRFDKKIGELSDDIMQKIKVYLKSHFDL